MSKAFRGKHLGLTRRRLGPTFVKGGTMPNWQLSADDASLLAFIAYKGSKKQIKESNMLSSRGKLVAKALSGKKTSSSAKKTAGRIKNWKGSL